MGDIAWIDWSYHLSIRDARVSWQQRSSEQPTDRE
jgi:hypothetical protein